MQLRAVDGILAVLRNTTVGDVLQYSAIGASKAHGGLVGGVIHDRAFKQVRHFTDRRVDGVKLALHVAAERGDVTLQCREIVCVGCGAAIQVVQRAANIAMLGATYRVVRCDYSP
ncbi:hypothetical protein D3C81_989690 [compost metagenome]